MRNIAIVIKNQDMQTEGLKTWLSLLGDGNHIEVFLLGQEMAKESDHMLQASCTTANFFSDNPVNVKRLGFNYASMDEMAVRLKRADLILPF